MSYPKVVLHDSRIAFGIDYFASEEDAITAALIVAKRGDTYNGGWYHGEPTGRTPWFDFEKDGVKLYAVTVR